MSSGSKRRWAEMAPWRESVMVHFTRPELRRRLEDACEALAEKALEEELGVGGGEPWLQACSRAGVSDLFHTQQALLALAATRWTSIVTEEDERLCLALEVLAADLGEKIADLERRLRPLNPGLEIGGRLAN